MQPKGFARIGCIVSTKLSLDHKVHPIVGSLKKADPLCQGLDRAWIPVHAINDGDAKLLQIFFLGREGEKQEKLRFVSRTTQGCFVYLKIDELLRKINL